LLDRSCSLSIATKVSKVFLVQDRGIRCDQFFHLQTFDLKSRSVVWQTGKHLLNLTNSARSTSVVVVVVRNDQFLGKTLQLFGIEWQWLDSPPARRRSRSLRLQFRT